MTISMPVCSSKLVNTIFLVTVFGQARACMVFNGIFYWRPGTLRLGSVLYGWPNEKNILGNSAQTRNNSHSCS